jgi:hypothetical protein
VERRPVSDSGFAAYEGLCVNAEFHTREPMCRESRALK